MGIHSFFGGHDADRVCVYVPDDIESPALFGTTKQTILFMTDRRGEPRWL